jgi:hypothetical protein
MKRGPGADRSHLYASLRSNPNGYKDPRRSIYAQPGTLDQEVLRRRHVRVRRSALNLTGFFDWLIKQSQTVLPGQASGLVKDILRVHCKTLTSGS